MTQNLLLEALAHLSNIIYIVGFTIKKMFWLRIMMIIGAVCEIIYFIFISDKPLWSSVFWAAVWIIVNSVQLLILIYEKLNLKMSEEETRLHQMSFQTMTNTDFKKIINLAEWKTSQPETVLVEEGKEINNLMLISTGVAEVHTGARKIAYIRDGNFIGEMSLISGGKTTASVTALTEIKYLEWQKDKLNHFLDKNPEIGEALRSVFNLDFVKKLSAGKE